MNRIFRGSRDGMDRALVGPGRQPTPGSSYAKGVTAAVTGPRGRRHGPVPRGIRETVPRMAVDSPASWSRNGTLIISPFIWLDWKQGRAKRAETDEGTASNEGDPPGRPRVQPPHLAEGCRSHRRPGRERTMDREGRLLLLGGAQHPELVGRDSG